MILDRINAPSDLKNLDKAQTKALCGEIRNEILRFVSKNGGHLASNLGVVELAVTVDKVFSLPNDKVIYDVGHQCYAHKILTGRREGLENLRTDGGVCGFTKRSESQYDAFGSGHSGNALSAAIGIAEADRISGKDSYTVAILGDGSFTNGMTYEAMNNCANSNLNLIIILNDNEMAISHNVGSIDNVFSKLRTSKRYFTAKNRFIRIFSSIPLAGKPIVSFARGVKNFFKRITVKENFFEALGLEYIGPVDGNDADKLETVLLQAKKSRKPCVVHINTIKGKGYAFAEEKPDSYHSVPKFDIETGVVSNGKEKTFSFNMGKCICRLAEEDAEICCVTAAMTGGTGLSEFALLHKDRFFDVGIAEEHAVTFCAGLSAGGYKPVFAVYSTFLQRSFDQILEDCSMQSLRLTLLIDRAGIVGDDGITHHGIFDVSLLNKIPNCLIYTPVSVEEMNLHIRKCVDFQGISAVRYAKGRPSELKGAYTYGENTAFADYGIPDKVIMTYGRLTEEAEKAAEKAGNTRVVRLIRINPVDKDEVLSIVGNMPLLFAEEGIVSGGTGELICRELENKTVIVGIENNLPEHGKYTTLLKTLGLDCDTLAEKLKCL